MNIRIIESPVKSENEREGILKFIHSQDSGWDKFYNDELAENDLFYKHWHIVMEDGGKFIGHCHVCQDMKHPELALFGFLETDNNFRGQGIAGKLYRQSMEALESRSVKLVMLSTGFGNAARLHIYLKDGFNDIFVGPEGGVTMAKVFGGKWQDYAGEYLIAGKSEGVVREVKYPDYLGADLIMNLKLGKADDKSSLPLNARGKHGGYCLFRDYGYSQYSQKLRVKEADGRIVDVII